MCSVITHPIVPLALAVLLPSTAVSPDVILAGAACAVIPDLDVIGFQYGIPSGHMLGHRGLTHSIAFAVVLGALLTAVFCRHSHLEAWVLFPYFFIATLSHALLDMLTNGGRGVALFALISSTRYFFPWRPIEVAPLGVRRFLSARGLQVMRSELRWVWLPAAGVVMLGMLVRGYG